MFVLGCMCLCWTALATRMFEMGVRCGIAVWSCPIRRRLRDVKSWQHHALMLTLAALLMLDNRLSPTISVQATSAPLIVAQRPPRQRRRCTDLTKLRAMQKGRWRILQEPLLLRRRQRSKRRAAAKAQRASVSVRHHVYNVALSGPRLTEVSVAQDEMYTHRAMRIDQARWQDSHADSVPVLCDTQRERFPRRARGAVRVVYRVSRAHSK